MTPAAAGDSSDEGGQSDDDDDDDDDEEEEEDGGEFVHGEGVGMSEAEERLVASFMNAGVWHYYVVRLLFCCFVVLVFRPPLPPALFSLDARQALAATIHTYPKRGQQQPESHGQHQDHKDSSNIHTSNTATAPSPPIIYSTAFVVKGTPSHAHEAPADCNLIRYSLVWLGLVWFGLV